MTTPQIRRVGLIHLVGTPIPAPARTLAPLDPDWRRYNEAILAQAEQRGDVDAARWYRRILRLEDK